MLAWFAAALIWPLVTLGLVFPGGYPDHSSAGSVSFNDPTGAVAEQYALIEQINAAVDAAAPGSVIRLAAYSFSLESVASRLTAAHRHGVGVQVVVDDHAGRWGPVRQLEDALGTDTTAGSFVKVCHASCRGGRGNQHSKFVLLSATGGLRDVVMVGSMNFTGYSSQRQWNDLYTVAGEEDLYWEMAEVFGRFVEDRPQHTLVLPPAGDGFETEVAPIRDYRAAEDPVLKRLDAVHCDGVTQGAGRDGHTVVRIALHAWNGDRGVRLAHRVADLQGSGCDLKVLYGVGVGPQIKNILRRAGVPATSSAVDGRLTHQKLMVVSGHFGAETHADYVWTGSHNWSDRSLRNDEVTLRVPGADTVHAYLGNFDKIWALAGGG